MGPTPFLHLGVWTVAPGPSTSLGSIVTNLLVVVQSLSRVRLFASLWTVAHRASLSITISWSLLKFMSIKSVMPSNHLILHHLLFLLASIFPSIRVFSNESALRIRWPKYWSFIFSISPSKEYSWLISFRIEWFDLLSPRDSQESSPAAQFESISSLVLSLLSGPTCWGPHPFLPSVDTQTVLLQDEL